MMSYNKTQSLCQDLITQMAEKGSFSFKPSIVTIESFHGSWSSIPGSLLSGSSGTAHLCYEPDDSLLLGKDQTIVDRSEKTLVKGKGKVNRCMLPRDMITVIFTFISWFLAYKGCPGANAPSQTDGYLVPKARVILSAISSPSNVSRS